MGPQGEISVSSIFVGDASHRTRRSSILGFVIVHPAEPREFDGEGRGGERRGEGCANRRQRYSIGDEDPEKPEQAARARREKRKRRGKGVAGRARRRRTSVEAHRDIYQRKG